MVTGSLIPGDRWQKMQIIVQSFILVLSTFGILECSAANPDPCSQKYTSSALGRWAGENFRFESRENMPLNREGHVVAVFLMCLNVWLQQATIKYSI